MVCTEMDRRGSRDLGEAQHARAWDGYANDISLLLSCIETHLSSRYDKQ